MHFSLYIFSSNVICVDCEKRCPFIFVGFM